MAAMEQSRLDELRTSAVAGGLREPDAYELLDEADRARAEAAAALQDLASANEELTSIKSTSLKPSEPEAVPVVLIPSLVPPCPDQFHYCCIAVRNSQRGEK